MVESASVTCPRCRASRISVLCKSPLKEVWTIYRCETCLYAWRDTEPVENRDADQYPDEFRIEQTDIEHFPIMPTVPPPLKT